MRYLISLLITVVALWAQTTTPSTNSPKLAFVIPAIREQAILAANNPAVANFLRTSISDNWLGLNSSVATQLSNLPNPSPASAYNYTYDPRSGTVQRSLRSLGPVLAERSETIGANKFFFAVTYQRFYFDRLDDVNLTGFEVTEPFLLPAGASGLTPTPGFLNIQASVDLELNETAAHFTYGITDWLDASYTFPFVAASLSVRGNAELVNSNNQRLQAIPPVSEHAAAAGLGDGVIRVKARFLQRPNMAAAFGTDVRLPIGDELNYLGAGAYGVKPFLVFSATSKHISPHLNAGYQWNGKSYLGSDRLNVKRSLPDQILLAAGFDVGVSSRMTFSADFLGQRVIKAQRSILSGPTAYMPTQTISFLDLSRNEYNAATGFKALLRPDLILTGNLMMRLNTAGLRARVVPLVALSYIF